MASNYKQRGDAFTVPKTSVSPSTFSVGTPVVVSSLPAVAMTSSSAAGDNATIWTYGIYDNMSVTNSAAVNIGDFLFHDGTTLTDDNSDNRWGYALEAIGSAGTSSIRVKVGY